MQDASSLKSPLIPKKEMLQVVDSSDIVPKLSQPDRINGASDKSKDAYYLAYIIMLFQGMGNLLPWNCLINAAPYYKQRFCGSPYASSFENVVSISYNGTQLIFLLLMLHQGDRYSQKKLIIGALTTNIMVFACMVVLVMVSEVAVETFYGLTIAGCLLSAAVTSVHQGAIFSAAAPFPPLYTQGLMTGQGMVGLANSLVGLLTASASSESDDENTSDPTQPSLEERFSSCQEYRLDIGALLYFGFACFMLLVTLISYLALLRLSFYKVNMRKACEYDVSNLVEFDYNRENDWEERSAAGTDISSEEMASSSQQHRKQLGHDSRLYSMCKAIQLVWRAALSVGLTFTVTLMLFPSSTSRIISTKKKSNSIFFSDNFFILFSFANFNFGDVLGRVLSGKFQLIGEKWLWVFSVFRFIFFPLFLLCNIEESRLPVIFKSDFYPIFFMVLFSISNGYISSLGMMYGPQNVGPAFLNSAATFMVFSLVLGLTIGSSLSFLTLEISTGSLS